MTTYQILCLIGVPSIISTIIGFVLGKFKDNRKKYAALELGVQALLRAQMISDYNKWSEKGYAPIYAKQNFENCWVQYENLGKNGVMSGIHKHFMELPEAPQEKEQ